ncbi:MAG: nuclear transport factor 2 family protein [Pyrinomonadaceae bacterium]
MLVPAQVFQINEDEQAIRALLREAAENEMTRDEFVFDRIAADEFVRIGTNGEVWDKARTREFSKENANSRITSIETQDLKIRIYGAAATVTALGIAKGQDRLGRDFTVRNRCSFMLVKRDDRWQCVSVQQTRVA